MAKIVHSGNVSSGVTLTAEDMTVYGSAFSTIVSSGGLMIVSSGGIAKDTVVNSNGSMCVCDNGSASNTTVNGGGKMHISSGGRAESTTVNSGYMYISNGGVANNVDFKGYGYMYVSGGGTVSGLTMHSGQARVSGGTVSGLTMYSGVVSASGGTVSNFAMHEGNAYFSCGAAVSNLSLGGGQFVLRGGSCIGGVISGGTLTATHSYIQGYKSYVADVTVLAGGCIFMNEDAFGKNITVSAGGVLGKFSFEEKIYISEFASGSAFIGKNAFVSGNSMQVLSGGTVRNVVNHGGEMTVYAGASALNIQGGSLRLNGGYANGIKNAQSVYISGGLAENVSGTGYGSIGSGGRARNVEIAGGGWNIYNGGIIESSVIGNNASAVVSEGGVASATEVKAGGTLNINAGGKHVGSLVVGQGATVTIAGELNFSIVGKTTSDDYLIQGLNSTDHSNATFTITVEAEQDDGTYKLADGLGADWASEFTIGNEYGEQFSDDDNTKILVGGGGFTFDQKTYTLTNSNGNLTLTITRDPSRPAAPDAPTLTATPKDWTNKDVTVKAKFDENVTVKEYSLDEGETWITYDESNGVVFTANGTVWFRGQDSNKRYSKVARYEVANIDKDAPMMSVSGQGGAWTQDNVVFNVSADDGEGCGLADLRYKINDGEFISLKNSDGTFKDSFEISYNCTVTVEAVDKAGNTLTETRVVDKIDKTGPTITLTYPNGEWVQSTAVLKAVADDGDGSGVKSVEYSLDGKTWKTGDTITLTGAATVYFRATDNCGLVSTQEFYYNKFDSDVPEITIQGNAPYWSNSIVLTGVATDATSGIKSVEYSLDGKTWKTGNSLTVTANGTVWFRTTDQAGNTAQDSVTVDKFDNVKPTCDILGSPTAWVDDAVTLQIKTADDLSGISQVLYCFDKENWVAADRDAETGNITVTVSENCTVYVRSIDAAGNETFRNTTISRIDKIAPEINVTTTGDASQKVVVTADAYDKDSGIKAIQYSFDGKTWKTGKSVTVTENRTIWFRAVDRSGKETTIEHVVDVIDTAAPELKINGIPEGWTCEDVVLKAEASDDVSGIKSVEYSFDGKNWIEGDVVTLSENCDYVQFRATDNAGRVTVSDPVKIDMINRVKPEITQIVASPTIMTYRDVTLTVKCTDDQEGVKTYYRMAEDQEWVEFNRNFKVGSNCTVQIKAVDVAGNESVAEYVVDNIDKTPADLPDVITPVFAPGSKEFTFTIAGKNETDWLQYSFDNDTWHDYTGSVAVSNNGNVYFRSINKLGLASEVVVREINRFYPAADAADTSYAFVKESYSAKINGKKQDGIVLNYNENAFNTIKNTPEGSMAVLLDSKNTLNALPDSISVIAGSAAVASESDTGKKYIYKANSKSARSVTVARDCEDVQLLRFSTVTVNNGVHTGIVSGGNASNTRTYTWNQTVSKATESDSRKTSRSASGKLTAGKNAVISEIDGYATVNLNKAEVTRTVTNYKESFSSTEKTVVGTLDGSVNVSKSVTNSTGTSGKLTAVDSVIGAVTGFDTVNLTGTASGDLSRVGEDLESYRKITESLKVTTKNDEIKAAYSETVSYTRAGSLTAKDSTVGNIVNYNKVTLDNSIAGLVENEQYSKIVSKYEQTWEDAEEYQKNGFSKDSAELIVPVKTTVSLSGSVTLKNGSETGVISNFASVSLSSSTVDGLQNVKKVAIKKGIGFIGTEGFVGTAENDTFTIDKGAVLHLSGDMDFGAGAKDKLVLNGTLILDEVVDIKNAAISGKGEIVAAADVFEQLDIDYGKVLNLGSTAQGFRGTASENADDTLKKAAAWDGEGFTGWLGSWESGSDSVDYLKFTINSGKELTVSGCDNWVLMDKKGNELNVNGKLVAGSYIIKLESAQEDSTSYQLALS